MKTVRFARYRAEQYPSLMGGFSSQKNARRTGRHAWGFERTPILLCVFALTGALALACSSRGRQTPAVDPAVAQRARAQLSDIGNTRQADRQLALALAETDQASPYFIRVWFSSFLPASQALALVPQDAEVLALYDGYGDVHGYFPLEQGETPAAGVGRLSNSLRAMQEDAEVRYSQTNGEPALWGLLLRGSGTTITELASLSSVYWLRVLRNRLHETPLYTPDDIARMRALCQCYDDTVGDAQ